MADASATRILRHRTVLKYIPVGFDVNGAPRRVAKNLLTYEPTPAPRELGTTFIVPQIYFYKITRIGPGMGREYRKHERRALGYPSTVMVEDILFPCHIIDVSAGGARLFVEDHTRIPDRFTVMLSAMGARREVTVMWRRGSHMGVRFDMPAGKIPGARAEHEADGKHLV